MTHFSESRHLRVLAGDREAGLAAAPPSPASTPGHLPPSPEHPGVLPFPEWRPLPDVDDIDRIFDRYEAALAEVEVRRREVELTLERISRGDAA